MGSIGIAGCDLSHRVYRAERRRNPANYENSVTAVFVAIRRVGAADWWPHQAPADTPEIAGLEPPELPAS